METGVANWNPVVDNGGHMGKVYFFTDIEKLPTALDLLNIRDFSGARVPVKLHMGEPGNRYYISPRIVKLTVAKLQEAGAEPFLFDTTVAYPSPRSKKKGYMQVADKHGFRKDKIGCDVIIGDKGIKVAEGGHSLEMAKEIYESSHLTVISHVKGHIQAGFGAAIKNLGMGGVTKKTKQSLHLMSIPRFLAEKCDLCGSCAEVCPCNAITVKLRWRYDSVACAGCGKCVSACPSGALLHKVMDFQKALALSARACVSGKRVLCINAVVNITSNCDCDPNPGSIICPDIGYLASNEPAAIDKASLELIHQLKPGVFEETTQVDPAKQIQYAQEFGLDNSYELVRL